MARFLGTLGKIAGGVGGFMLGGPAGAAAGYSLASGLVDGNNAQQQAERAQAQQLQFEKDRWNAGQPFRDAGTAMLNREFDPAALTSLFVDSGNPYAKGNTFQPVFKPAATASPTAAPDPREAQLAEMRSSLAYVPNDRARKSISQGIDRLEAQIANDRARTQAFSQTMGIGR